MQVEMIGDANEDEGPGSDHANPLTRKQTDLKAGVEHALEFDFWLKNAF